MSRAAPGIVNCLGAASLLPSLEPDNPLKNVRMRQWMYGQGDGGSMMNRVTVTKLGVVVAEVTEFSQRAPAAR